jgi:hypothetical protein
MPLARLARSACLVSLALLAGPAASAQAATRSAGVLVLEPGGHVRAHRSTGATTSEARPPRAATAARARAAAKPRRTVVRELKRLRDRGALTPEAYAERRAAYDDAKRTVRTLRGVPRLELAAVVATLDGIAARGRLTPSRLAPLWLTLQRNVEWWTTGPLPAPGQRAGFAGSELVWQYYRGQGMQIQWLGTFGKLNALAKARTTRTNPRTSLLVDEILALASERAGGLAWEYEFAFGGGSAPWVSSLAQGTGLQALARAAVKLGRQADVFPVASRALNVFERAAPEGVRVAPQAGWAGPHYAQYSFAPSLRILNGFVQSIVGLHDYAQISGDPRAQALYVDGEREAAHEVPQFDTGAWSLYSRGSSQRESDAGYHELLRDFLVSMCDRTRAPVYCDTAARFTAYEGEPPALELAAQRLRGGKRGTLRVRLSKISSVTVTIRRGDRVVLTRSLGTVGHGLVRVPWSVPRRAGSYDVAVTARDLVGNAGERSGSVEVLKPARKRRG